MPAACDTVEPAVTLSTVPLPVEGALGALTRCVNRNSRSPAAMTRAPKVPPTIAGNFPVPFWKQSSLPHSFQVLPSKCDTCGTPDELLPYVAQPSSGAEKAILAGSLRSEAPAFAS